MLQDQETLNQLAKKEPIFRNPKRLRFLWMDESTLYTELLSEGFISIDNNVVTVDSARLTVLTNFISFLKRKGEFRRPGNILIHEDIVEVESEEHKLLKSDADKTGAV